jgi:hypothetical protein
MSNDPGGAPIPGTAKTASSALLQWGVGDNWLACELESEALDVTPRLLGMSALVRRPEGEDPHADNASAVAKRAMSCVACRKRGSERVRTVSGARRTRAV